MFDEIQAGVAYYVAIQSIKLPMDRPHPDEMEKHISMRNEKLSELHDGIKEAVMEYPYAILLYESKVEFFLDQAKQRWLLLQPLVTKPWNLQSVIDYQRSGQYFQSLEQQIQNNPLVEGIQSLRTKNFVADDHHYLEADEVEDLQNKFFQLQNARNPAVDN